MADDKQNATGSEEKMTPWQWFKYGMGCYAGGAVLCGGPHFLDHLRSEKILAWPTPPE